MAKLSEGEKVVTRTGRIATVVEVLPDDRYRVAYETVLPGRALTKYVSQTENPRA